MKNETKRPKVALVYPPFGPHLFPSLGLALLSAGVKKLGFECRTFYWNLDLIPALPGSDLSQKLHSYYSLASQVHFPLNEWIFSSPFVPESEHLNLRAQLILAVKERILLNPNGRLPLSATSFGLRVKPPSIGIKWQPSKPLEALRGQAEDLVDDMANKLATYDIVGIGTSYCQNVPALALAKRLKERWADKVVVLGGSNCAGEMGPALFQQFPFVDYVFSGEVDFSFPEFVRRLSLDEAVDQLPGITIRTPEGHVLRGPQAPPLCKLDTLPVPDFDDYVAAREELGIAGIQKLTLALEASRGCWWGAKQHCTFCGLNTDGMAYRKKNRERFQWEVEEITRRYDPQLIGMTDNILSMDYFGDFMDWAKNKRFHFDFFCETKANLTRHKVEQLAQAGFTLVQPGIESFSTHTLKLMKKGVSGIQNIALLKYAYENGLRLFYFIIYGFPGEDPREYRQMQQQVKKLFHLQPPEAIIEIGYHRFSPYHNAPETFGLELRPDQQYEVLYPFPEDVIARLTYFFARKNRPSFSYVNGLKRQVRRWRRDCYSSNALQRPSLCWEQVGEDIVVRDRRPDFPRRNYRLRRYATHVFRALDKPTTLKAVVRRQNNTGFRQPKVQHSSSTDSSPPKARNGETTLRDFIVRLWSILAAAPRPLSRSAPAQEEVIDFDEEQFGSQPAACLKRLVETGIAYVEGDRYLALPITSDAPGPYQAAMRWTEALFGSSPFASPWEKE